MRMQHVTERWRMCRGVRIRNYDAEDMATLAQARRWLNGHGLRRLLLDDEERARRAELYRRQIEETGRIEYLPPAPERERRRQVVRFAAGDALGRHLRAASWR